MSRVERHAAEEAARMNKNEDDSNMQMLFPYITDVTDHWYYKKIDFMSKYKRAKKATIEATEQEEKSRQELENMRLEKEKLEQEKKEIEDKKSTIDSILGGDGR